MPPPYSRAAPAIVFAVAFAFLSWNIFEAGIAGSYVDPVGRITSQDEAVYSHTATHMAEQGDWLTPRFMHRFALYKPPLLYWASGISAKVFGKSPFTLRLPSLLAAAAIAVIVFQLTRSLGVWAAISATLLLLSNRLFFTLSRLNLTDMLLALCFVTVAYCLWRDRRLQKFWWIAGAASGAALMTKGVAGLLPLLLIAAMWPGWRCVARITAVAALVAAPWHLYQLAVHPRWFWAEYVLVEIFAFGAGTPPQTSQETQIGFYLKRLWLTDPVLMILSIGAIFFWIRKRRDFRLLLTWAGVIAFAVMAFQYRNASYLLPLIPALAIWCAPMLNRPVAAAALAAVLAAKVTLASQPWGLPFSGSAAPSAAVLHEYAQMHRARELIIVSPDDDFYATLLPIERLRYCFIGLPETRRYALDFRELGIILDGPQYSELSKWQPVFESRLREWALNDPRAIGTVIAASNAGDVRTLIAAHPAVDFYVPVHLAGSPHHVLQVKGSRALLLAQK